MFLEAPDVTYFWRLSSAHSASFLGGPGGMVPQEMFLKRTLRNVVSSASGNQVSVSQVRLEFTQILLKSKIVNGNRDKWYNTIIQ